MVRMTRTITTGLSWIFLLAVVTVSTVKAQECDQCFFDGNDADDCLVYGKIGGELIGWTKASVECLSAFQIRIVSSDPSTVCNSSNAFVNALRFGSLTPDSVKFGIGDFYDDNGSGNPVLKDAITIATVVYNCKVEEGNCYNAMKSYFEVEPGLSEMTQVCETLSVQQAVDRELEQVLVRNRLCQEARDGNSVAECEPLYAEVQEEASQRPDKACSSFSFGAGTTVTAGCRERAAAVDGLSSSNAAVTGTSLFQIPMLLVAGAAVALVLD